MFDFTHKSVYVAGGCGLIGRAIVRAFREQGAEAVSVDIMRKPEVRLDICKIGRLRAFLKGLSEFDVWVNASYPKDHREHLHAFLYPTMLAADKLALLGKGGAIINIASIYGVLGPDYRIYHGTHMTMPTAYSAVKGGVIALSRCYAAEYAKHGIRINTVSPGGVYDGQDIKFVKNYCDRVPLGRMATPEDVAGAVVFLASQEAAYLTGQNLMVDGGLTAW